MQMIRMQGLLQTHLFCPIICCVSIHYMKKMDFSNTELKNQVCSIKVKINCSYLQSPFIAVPNYCFGLIFFFFINFCCAFERFCHHLKESSFSKWEILLVRISPKKKNLKCTWKAPAMWPLYSLIDHIRWSQAVFKEVRNCTLVGGPPWPLPAQRTRKLPHQSVFLFF